jgi:hypothetical protein
LSHKEDAMGFRLSHGTLALALVALAAANGNAQTNQGPEQAGSVRGDTQPAGSEPPPPPTDTSSAMSAPTGPIGSSPETMPAKFNEDVAARDRVPIMARPLPLTDEQKRKIYDSVMSNTQAPPTPIAAEPATILPGSVELWELPPGVEDQIPAVRGYKFVKGQDKVLLVSPPNRVVVGEITR